MNPTFSDLVLGSELKSLLTQPSQHIVFAIKDTKKSYQPYDQTPSLTSSQTTPALKDERSFDPILIREYQYLSYRLIETSITFLIGHEFESHPKKRVKKDVNIPFAVMRAMQLGNDVGCFVN